MNPYNCKHRLYIKGVLMSASYSYRMARIALKTTGYRGDDWIIWFGSAGRPMMQVKASGYHEGGVNGTT